MGFSKKLNEMLSNAPGSTYGSNIFARVLKKKVKHNSGRQWYGWLTAKEVLYIVDCWKCKASDEKHVEWARECVKKGDGTPRHFYFEVVDPVKLKLGT